MIRGGKVVQTQVRVRGWGWGWFSYRAFNIHLHWFCVCLPTLFPRFHYQFRILKHNIIYIVISMCTSMVWNHNIIYIFISMCTSMVWNHCSKAVEQQQHLQKCNPGGEFPSFSQILHQILALPDLPGVSEEHDLWREMQTLQVSPPPVMVTRTRCPCLVCADWWCVRRLKCHNKCTKEAPSCRISFLPSECVSLLSTFT